MNGKMVLAVQKYGALAKQRAEITGEMMVLYEEIVTIQKEENKPIDYGAYLKSPEWKAKARAARGRAGGRCQLCNAKDRELHVHHRTYENVPHEKDEDLTALCKVCHGRFHAPDESGRPTNMPVGST